MFTCTTDTAELVWDVGDGPDMKVLYEKGRENQEKLLSISRLLSQTRLETILYQQLLLLMFILITMVSIYHAVTAVLHISLTLRQRQ